MSTLSDLCHHYRIFSQECICFCLNVIHFCLLLPPPASPQRDFQSEERSVGGGGGRPRMCLNLYFAFRCLFCETPPIYLSEHILRDVRMVLTETRRIGRRVHILFSLHTSCSFNSGKLLCLKKSCHYFVTQSPRWHLQQITSQVV